MTVEEIVAQELARLRPQLTKREWLMLGDVIAEALMRSAKLGTLIKS